jgi:hypothetical protein
VADEVRKFSLPAKFVTGFAIGALLGFGLCTAGILRNIESTSTLASFGAACFWISLVGLIASLVWLAVHKSSTKR